MLSCLNVAKYFIAKAYESEEYIEITDMKVQKLLYYAQCLHLALYDEPLFREEIQAWRYGPVCPEAYCFYSKFEAEQLPIPELDFLDKISPKDKEVLEEVWQYFGDHGAYTLSQMTHKEAPWKNARQGLPKDAGSRNPLSLEDMKVLGEEKLDEIERNHPDYQTILTRLIDKAFAPKENPEYVSQGEVNDWLNSLLH